MNWQKELYNHEISPPHEAWSRIAHDLDNEFLTFRQKMLSAEVPPPDQSWDQILQTLDTHDKPASSIIRKWLRVGVAAALLGISFFTVNYFMTEKSNTGSANVVQPAVRKSNTPQNGKVNGSSTTEKPDKMGASPLIASRIPDEKNIRSFTRQPKEEMIIENETQRTFSISSVPPDPTLITDRYRFEAAAERKIRNLKGEIREDVSLLDLPNSYFYTTGPNGQTVRVSAKFRNTIQYLNSNDQEEMLDVILRESQYWKNKFRTWKEKVGHSSFIPSSENFMDIAELMKLLQEHKIQ